MTPTERPSPDSPATAPIGGGSPLKPWGLAGATFWSASDLVLKHGIPLMVGMLLARLLTPNDFGLVALLVAFSSVGFALVEGGFGLALVRMRSSTPDDETTAFVLNMAASIVLAILLIAAGPVLALAFGSPELRVLVYPAALGLPLSAAAIVPAALLSRVMDFKTQALCAGVAAATAGMVAIGMAFYGYGAWSLALQLPIAAGVRSLLLIHLRGWRPAGRVSSTAARSLVKFGGWLQAATIVDVLFQRIQAILVGRIFGPPALGQFAQAQNLQASVNALLGGVLSRVGLPALAAIQDDKAAFARGFRAAGVAGMLVNVPGVVILVLLSNEVVRILLGDQWTTAAELLSVLALCGVLWPLQVINLTALNAVGRSDLFFRAEIAKKIPGVLLVTAVAPFGVVPLAWAVVAVSVYAYFVNAWWAGQLFGFGVTGQLRSIVRVLLCGAAMAVAMMLCEWLMDPSIFRAALMVTVGLLVYAAAVFAVRPPELSALLGALFAPRQPSQTR